MNDLISRKALIAEYDRVHIGEPGKARKLMEDAPAVREWIPVSERLPESYKLVLAVCKNGKIFVGEYVDLGWRTLWRIKTARDSTKEITRIVTHWMPLPEPPKGE